jgi:hypothetical protein
MLNKKNAYRPRPKQEPMRVYNMLYGKLFKRLEKRSFVLADPIAELC